MSAIWRSVILSPLGTPLTYWSIVSSSDTIPSSAAWRSRVAVKVLVTLPIRWCTSGVIGSLEARSATPRAPTHVYSGVCTAATTPGASLSRNDFFNAASRSALDACSLPPVVCLPAVEPSLLPSPPLHPLPSRSTNPVTRSTPFHIDRCVFCANNLSPFIRSSIYSHGAKAGAFLRTHVSERDFSENQFAAPAYTSPISPRAVPGWEL